MKLFLKNARNANSKTSMDPNIIHPCNCEPDTFEFCDINLDTLFRCKNLTTVIKNVPLMYVVFQQYGLVIPNVEQYKYQRFTSTFGRKNGSLPYDETKQLYALLNKLSKQDYDIKIIIIIWMVATNVVMYNNSVLLHTKLLLKNYHKRFYEKFTESLGPNEINMVKDNLREINNKEFNIEIIFKWKEIIETEFPNVIE